MHYSTQSGLGPVNPVQNNAKPVAPTIKLAPWSHHGASLAPNSIQAAGAIRTAPMTIDSARLRTSRSNMPRVRRIKGMS